MYISDKYKFVLISNVNTASRSICDFLSKNYEFEEKTPKHSYRLAGVRKRFDEEYTQQVKEYSVIMTSRDPFDRAISIWARIVKNKFSADGYGTFWTTFPEFAKFIETYMFMPYCNFPGYECPYGARWSEEHQYWVALPLSQQEVYNWAVEDFGSVDYILDFANKKSIESLPFVIPPVELPHIGASGVSASEYDTEENRRLVSLWDKGIK